MKKDKSGFWLMLIVGIGGLVFAFVDYFYYNYSFSLPTQITNIGISLLLIIVAFYYRHKKARGYS